MRKKIYDASDEEIKKAGLGGLQKSVYELVKSNLNLTDKDIAERLNTTIKTVGVELCNASKKIDAFRKNKGDESLTSKENVIERGEENNYSANLLVELIVNFLTEMAKSKKVEHELKAKAYGNLVEGISRIDTGDAINEITKFLGLFVPPDSIGMSAERKETERKRKPREKRESAKSVEDG